MLTEHIGLGSLNVKTRTKEDDEHIYKRDTEWLRSSDVLIAECTNPSHGVGYELAYAEARNILSISSMTSAKPISPLC